MREKLHFKKQAVRTTLKSQCISVGAGKLKRYEHRAETMSNFSVIVKC